MVDVSELQEGQEIFLTLNRTYPNGDTLKIYKPKTVKKIFKTKVKFTDKTEASISLHRKLKSYSANSEKVQQEIEKINNLEFIAKVPLHRLSGEKLNKIKEIIVDTK